MQKVLLSIIGGFVVFSALADDSVITPVTTKDYVDNVISDKQPLSPITGTNKIMTYGATTGAQTGSRDIETTSLGTDTTADKVAAAGIIVAALNDKQDNVMGSPGWAMTGSPRDGGYGGKPVYDVSNNYSNALVTAETVNNAAIAAANSEFSCETYVEGAAQIPDNCLIWRIHTEGPTLLPTPRVSLADPNMRGSSYCNRGLDSTSHYYNNVDGECSAETLAYLGVKGNKSGKWGAVMPYGDVMGISLCSSISGTYGAHATPEQTATLDSEYTTQTSTGNAVGENCWCKIEQPFVSKWEYNNHEMSSCAQFCAFYCSYHMRYRTLFRQGILNTTI